MRERDRICTVLLVVLVVLTGGLLVSAGGMGKKIKRADDCFQHPILRIPKLTTPPVLDGKLTSDEWKDAAAFTGLTAESVSGHGSLVPTMQQVVWYIGYDDKYLYLAMRSPNPKGTYPVARIKENDSDRILFEDHVEIQLLTYPRNKATTPGKGFYKIMVNPKGAVSDMHLWNGTIGTEKLWSTGGVTKCHVTEDYWDLELSVDISRMGIKKLEGRDLVIQLVRTDSCAGMYFAGWVGATWLSWNKFAQVSFDPKVPVFQLLKIGEIGAGELDAAVKLVGTQVAVQEVTVQITVENAGGKVIYNEKQSAKMAKGDCKEINFKKSGLPISVVDIANKAMRNHFEIKATIKQGNKTVVLYHNRSPFMQFDDKFRKKYTAPWVKGRPHSGEWEYKIAYLPYSNKAEVSVDLDFFGVPKEILKAEKYQVDIRKKGGRKVLANITGKIVNYVGSKQLMELPELADGDYEAEFSLLGENKVIAKKKTSFARKQLPWEHNQLGISDEVIPPFLPIIVQDAKAIRLHKPRWRAYHQKNETVKNAVTLWGRNYQFGPGGLATKMFTAPPTGSAGLVENLLKAPIKFDLKAQGKIQQSKDATYKFTAKHGDRVDIAGSQELGPVKIEARSFVEYDGWVEVNLKVIPNGTQKIDYLDLVINLEDRGNQFPVDTLYIQRMGDGRYGNLFGGIPRRPGIHFKSTSLLEYKRDKNFDWKTFVPRTYVGNGDRGLWFFAWSASGWELKDKQPMMQVERLKSGDVRMRVRLLAGPVNLEKTRKLKFAIQAAPVKPNYSRYRTAQEEQVYAHDTRGYRYYGDAVDSYCLEREEDYEALRKFILYGPRYQKHGRKRYAWWNSNYAKEIGEGTKVLMYGSGRLTGVANVAFRLFGGEWIGNSEWKANQNAASTAGKWNYQGTIQYNKPEQLSVNEINWTQSYTDFFLWYHKPLLDKAGFNGTWWDNTSVFTVWQYNSELGRMESTWGFYVRRHLMKRLNALGWEQMRPPLWASNMHVDISWNQVFWMVENDWYADAPDITSIDQWGMDQFRSMCRTKSTCMIASPWLKGFRGTTPEMDRKIKRSLLAMLMSHDIHQGINYNRSTEVEMRKLLLKFRSLVDLPNTVKCLFAGYWQTGDAIKTSGKNVYASVYRNSDLETAVILFFSGDKRDQYLAGTTFDINKVIPVRGKLLEAKRVYDLETGEEIDVDFDGKVFSIKDQFPIKKHDFRMLAIEAE